MGKGRTSAQRCFRGRDGASGAPLALVLRRSGQVRRSGRGARAVNAAEVDLEKINRGADAVFRTARPRPTSLLPCAAACQFPRVTAALLASNPQAHSPAWRHASSKSDRREEQSLPVSVGYLRRAAFVLPARSFPSSWPFFTPFGWASIVLSFENTASTKIPMECILYMNT